MITPINNLQSLQTKCSWEDHPEGFVDLEYHVYTRFEINQVDQFLEQFYDTLKQEANANE